MWAVKFQHDILNTSAQGHNHWTVHRPKCPYCDDCSNHWQHHLICPHISRREKTQEVIDKVLLRLRQLTTDPDIYKQIKYGLAKWLTQLDDNPIEERLELEYPEQNAIGWYQFLRGYWARELIQAQHNFYRFAGINDNTTNGPTWALQVLRTIWTEMHNLWKYHTSGDHPPFTDPQIRQDLMDRITQIQQQHKQAMPHDDFSFHFTEVDFRLSSSARFYNWLALHEETTPRRIRIYQAQQRLQQPDILRAIQQVTAALT